MLNRNLFVVMLFAALTASAQKINFNWRGDDMDINDCVSGTSYQLTKVVYKIRDLWAHKEVGNTSKPFVTELLSHDVIVLRLTPDLP